MKYLKIFTDFLEIAQGLSDSTLARLFRAMLAYALNDTEPAFKGNERALWLMVRQSIDREKEAYEAKVDNMERCREVRKQKEIKQIYNDIEKRYIYFGMKNKTRTDARASALSGNRKPVSVIQPFSRQRDFFHRSCRCSGMTPA